MKIKINQGGLDRLKIGEEYNEMSQVVKIKSIYMKRKKSGKIVVMKRVRICLILNYGHRLSQPETCAPALCTQHSPELEAHKSDQWVETEVQVPAVTEKILQEALEQKFTFGSRGKENLGAG